MGLFGVDFRAPSLPSLSSVRDSVAKGLDSARDLGSSALDRANQLGQAGLDLGRKALADPEGTVRSVAAAARQGVRDGTEAVQGGVRDGVMWTGRQIHAGADLARSAVPGDNIVSTAIRDGITSAEDRTRFTVGVAGGVLSEGAGLVGTVGTLSISAAELQVSPTARQELGNTIVGGLERGGKAAVDYGQALASDPSRVLGDVQDAVKTGYDATVGFVEGQAQRHQDAFKRGEGWETLGMSTGQVATYVVPVGGGPVRGLAQAGVRAAARDGAELVVREAVESVPLASGPRLLPGEGMVGTYDDLIAAGAKGDNITPHHIPSANRMALEGVSKGDGIAINMEQPVPGVGGRHRATFTYGAKADIDMTARDALAAGIRDARQIYQADGLYTPEIRSSLQDLIRMNKAEHPSVFVK